MQALLHVVVPGNRIPPLVVVSLFFFLSSVSAGAAQTSVADVHVLPRAKQRGRNHRVRFHPARIRFAKMESGTRSTLSYECRGDSRCRKRTPKLDITRKRNNPA
jgi:hypothetical protein